MRKTKSPSSLSSGTLATAAAKALLTPTALIAVRTWLAEQLMAQEYAKLGQGGHTQNQVPLRQVFVDLPVTNSLSAVHQHARRLLFLDKLIKAVAERLQSAFRPVDTVARLGGDEFVLVLYDQSSEELISRETERIDKVFRRHLILMGKRFLSATAPASAFIRRMARMRRCC